MTPQLYSIDHAPPSLPIWHTILEDLGNPPAKRVARVLGIGRRTVYRYHQTGRAPRPVLLALFWLTRWGRSSVHTQATNDALMACSLVRSLNDRIAELAGQLQHLQLVGRFGSANAPLVDVPLTGPRALPDGGIGGGPTQWGSQTRGIGGATPDGGSSRLLCPLDAGPDAFDAPPGCGEGRQGVEPGTEDAPAATGPGTAPGRPAKPGGRRRRPA
jgi:predicted DNA-binding transcriptional regulator AlpA